MNLLYVVFLVLIAAAFFLQIEWLLFVLLALLLVTALVNARPAVNARASLGGRARQSMGQLQPRSLKKRVPRNIVIMQPPPVATEKFLDTVLQKAIQSSLDHPLSPQESRRRAADDAFKSNVQELLEEQNREIKALKKKLGSKKPSYAFDDDDDD